MDYIHIRDLSLRAIIGIYPEERRERQELLFNLELGVDLRCAGVSDQIADTVDYKALKRRIVAHVEATTPFLLEKAAEDVARICLDTPGVETVRVILDKPGALRRARSVAVEIRRP